MTKYMGGDWAEFATAGDALDKLTDSTGAFGSAIGDGKQTMLQGWSGSAADASGGYFDTLMATLQEHPAVLHSAAQECRAIAMGMQQTNDGAAAVVTGLIDMAIAIAAFMALAAATSWTGFGGAAAMSAAASLSAIAASQWYALLKMLDTAAAAASAFAGTVMTFGAALGSMGELPLPAGAYDNPQVL